MREKLVPSAWLEREGRRLDCGPYLYGAVEARVLLDKLPVRKFRLDELTVGGIDGIFHAGRESRRYVDDPGHGHPFLTSTDILLSDLSHIALISKRQVASTPKFIIREGWTLVTRSGTIGRMAFARPEMDGMACSEDVLRVVPNQQLVPSGYLYAYLSSRFGVPLVVGDEYGSVQRHIEPQHVRGIPVPRLPESVESKAHALVTEAARLRFGASKSLAAARELLRRELGAPPVNGKEGPRLGHAIPSSAVAASSRFEAFFHNPRARLLDKWIASYRRGHTELKEAAAVFDVPPFKHIYVEAGHGTPFFTSGDLFLLDRRPEKYLSRKVTKDLQKYIVQKGWVLLARSGQLGGIIGRPQFADGGLDGAATSDHVIRIIPRPGWTAGFIHTYLSLEDVGYQLLVRTATGASVPALWPSYLNRIRLPKVPEEQRARLDEIVSDAFEERVEATRKEDSARTLVEETIAGLGNHEWPV